jgi:hypothetical protein
LTPNSVQQEDNIITNSELFENEATTVPEIILLKGINILQILGYTFPHEGIFGNWW